MPRVLLQEKVLKLLLEGSFGCRRIYHSYLNRNVIAMNEIKLLEMVTNAVKILAECNAVNKYTV